jgi:murein DD-endopeptidase MepM/ murein hydrolase activator NlpD
VAAVGELEVVAAVDDVAERQWVNGLRESWRAIRNARRYATGRAPFDPRVLAGNHVIVRSAEAVALYAHLAPGSVAVRAGDRVPVGAMIGRVGHTGNSTAPHLHFQLMDSTDVHGARGVPCAFARYLERRDGDWVLVGNGIPGRHERIRSVAT